MHDLRAAPREMPLDDERVDLIVFSEEAPRALRAIRAFPLVPASAAWQARRRVRQAAYEASARDRLDQPAVEKLQRVLAEGAPLIGREENEAVADAGIARRFAKRARGGSAKRAIDDHEIGRASDAAGIAQKNLACLFACRPKKFDTGGGEFLGEIGCLKIARRRQ